LDEEVGMYREREREDGKGRTAYTIHKWRKEVKKRGE